MANRADGNAQITQLQAGLDRSWFEDGFYTGTIYRQEMTMRKDDGLIDQAGPGQANPVFTGVAMQDAIASSTPAQKLALLRKGVFKATVQTTDAAAVAAQSFRIKGSGGSDALVAADVRKPVYATDSMTLEVDPADDSAPVVGYIDHIVSISGGVCYVVLDTDWAAAFSGATSDAEALRPIASPAFDGVDIGSRMVITERFLKRPALAADVLTFTDSSGGSAATPNTIAAITAGGGTYPDEGPVENAIAKFAAKINTMLVKNVDFELAGTNMTTALCTFAAGGGVTLTTAGAAADQAILQPNSISAHTRWNAGFRSNKRLRFSTKFQLSSVAGVTFKVGLALTNAVNRTTDDDQVAIMFDTAGAVSTTAFTLNTSIAGTDAEVTTGIAAAAATEYRVVFDIDENRVCRVYLNDVLVGTTAALTSLATLKPFVAVHAIAAAAKAVTVRYESASEDNA
jgi:hypothetical protein